MKALQGVCEKWSKRGFGFIKAGDGRRYFVHWSNIIKDGYKALEVGDEVEFNEGDGEKGPVAINVSVL